MRLEVSLVLLLAVTCLAAKDAINANLVNREITRRIDLRTQIAHASYEFEIENTGSSAAANFHFAVDAHHGKQLAFLEATVSHFSDVLSSAKVWYDDFVLCVDMCLMCVSQDEEKRTLRVTRNVQVQSTRYSS